MLLFSIANHSDKNMMGLQNLCTLFGPTLMKLSPKDNREIQVEDMGKEIKESMQQAQVLFYLLQLHGEDRLVAEPNDPDKNVASSSSPTDKKTDNDPTNETLTKLNLKSNSPDESRLAYVTDKNNNNVNKTYVNVIPNSPEKKVIHQSAPTINIATATTSPTAQQNRQQPNTGDKYTKINMQTAL